ncbi:unnamed protein product [Mortierella alpina]
MTELTASTHRDFILTESSFFWKIEVEPTRFPDPFCESVTRFFVSEPEPCGQQDHRWKCSLTENMINGKATIDIEIWRVKAPSPQQPQQPLTQQQEYQERPESQTHFQKHDQAKQQQLDNSIIRYKTLALHTPRILSPVASTFIHRSMIDDNAEAHPILELDASVVLHRGTYQIEFALSEENSLYETPSPSASLHVFDALFHNVVAIFELDPSTADIWFEFPTPNDDRQPIAFVGAHERILSKYKFLSEWIEHERREREEQRRQQLEEEWRIHQHLQWGQEQERASTTAPHDNAQQRLREATSLGPRIGHQFERHAGHTASQSQQRGRTFSSITESLSSSLQPTRPSLRPEPLQPPRPAMMSRGQIHTSASTSTARTPPPPHSLYASSTTVTPIPQVQLRYQSQSLPVLRITVKDISLEVFQVLLQFVYTGTFSLTDSQRVEVEDYWSINPENHHRLTQEASRTCAQVGGERPVDAPKECVPILLPPLGSSSQEPDAQQQAWEPQQDQRPKSFTAPLDTWPDPDPYSFPRSDHHPLSPQVYRHHHGGRPSCSWEDLLLAANKLHLKPLQDLAMRALQYRCQMLAVQASLNNSVMAEVAHNGFDETKLDVQLALGDEILRSLLSLYTTQPSQHKDEVQEWINARAPTAEHEPPYEQEGDDETEDEDTAVQVISRVGRFEEAPVSSHPVASTTVSTSALLRTRVSPIPAPHPIELPTLPSTPGATREQLRVIQEHMERSIDVCRSEAASSSFIAHQEAKRQRRGSRQDTELLSAAFATSPSTPLPSGQNNDGDDNEHNSSERFLEESLLDDPESEHAIMDLCKEIRLRFMRMRDIMEPSRH